MAKLTKSEFKAVTEAFINRFVDSMANAGCNDLFEDEFPKSVCKKFDSDIELFEEWRKMLESERS